MNLHAQPSDKEMTVPYIDPNVRHVPVSYLRRMNMQTMREQSNTLVIDGLDGEEPFVVILPYKTFLLIQEQLQTKGE